MTRPELHSVIILGAGFSGLNMAIRLRQAGHDDFVVLERANKLGGTWRDNVYPGCACDVPSMLYSYSFEQNPEWTTAFAGSDEIQAYLSRCAEKYGVTRHLRFGTSIERAEFDEHAGLWTLHAEDGRTFAARLVVSAVGGLVSPSWPDVPGRERFQGKAMHTARWDRGYDLAGKRVAVIGTGASAVQVIPSIQPTVSSLTVFQRTPAWVMPKLDPRIRPEVRAIFRHFPLAQRVLRNTIFFLSEAVMAPAVIIDSPLSRVFENQGRAHLHRQVRDPALRAKLMPSFHVGCKRILISNDYYRALTKPNVELVTDAIEGFTERGLRTADGREHELDVVVFATGFKIEIHRAPYDIRGLGGLSLSDAWKRPGAKAYKGVATAGIPNWFFMLGPNTGPGHTSVLVYTEAQADYILQAVERVLTGGIKYLSVKRAVQDYYGRKLKARMRYTTWSSGCVSWYLDENGENHTLYPGLASEYVLGMRRFDDHEYVEVPFVPRTSSSTPGSIDPTLSEQPK